MLRNFGNRWDKETRVQPWTKHSPIGIASYLKDRVVLLIILAIKGSSQLIQACHVILDACPPLYETQVDFKYHLVITYYAYTSLY